MAIKKKRCRENNKGGMITSGLFNWTNLANVFVKSFL